MLKKSQKIKSIHRKQTKFRKKLKRPRGRSLSREMLKKKIQKRSFKNKARFKKEFRFKEEVSGHAMFAL